MATGKKRHRSKVIRGKRIRKRLRAVTERPRLSVFRSHRHVYAQIIDDAAGKTLVAASTRSKEFKGKKGSDLESAKEVGKLLGQKAGAENIKEVCFDRGSYLYHGRVKALAEGARESGLKF